MRNINRIVIHCSDSEYGDATLIDRWHKARGWKGIGYHYVINNPYTTSRMLNDGTPAFDRDGAVEHGRDIEEIGAHVHGYNKESIGICLIGKRVFTSRQFDALTDIVWGLLDLYPGSIIQGHYELDPAKTCPNLDMDYLRELMNRF